MSTLLTRIQYNIKEEVVIFLDMYIYICIISLLRAMTKVIFLNKMFYALRNTSNSYRNFIMNMINTLILTSAAIHAEVQSVPKKNKPDPDI